MFEKNAKEIGEKYKAICERYGHKGLYPLDNECDNSKDIYEGNVALINEADAVIANGNEFRGETDAGTAFEIGYAAAKNKQILIYMSDPRSLIEKLGKEDEKGRAVENFGYPVNLMLAESAQIINGTFEDCVKKISL